MSTITNAIAERDTSPSSVVAQYTQDFANVLPSHIKAETFVRLAQGVLRRNPTLEQAARSNPASLLAALLDAARLGLEPGTEQYYLVPFKDRGRPLVQGVPGYQGEIELMYRAGAVSSVVVEVVRERDVFEWIPGRPDPQSPPQWIGPQSQPYHKVDWFGERGALKGVYAYAQMTDGAISKVVVLNQAKVYEARAKSASFRSKPETSPWTTDEEAMWLKTGAHRLRKWVPTSAEYRRELARSTVEAQRITAQHDLPPMPVDLPEFVDGEVLDGPEQDWPETAVPGGEPA